jgi:hypothetical protein
MEGQDAPLARIFLDQDPKNPNPIPLPASDTLPTKSSMRTGASLVMRTFQRVKWGVHGGQQSVGDNEAQGGQLGKYVSPCTRRSRVATEERRKQRKRDQAVGGVPMT